MKKNLLVFLIFFMFTASLFTMPIQEAKSAGEFWLVGWNYRKSHVIENATGAGTNYQVKIEAYAGSGVDTVGKVYLGGKALSSFADVRFTDDDGITELDYWLESVEQATANITTTKAPQGTYEDGTGNPVLDKSVSGWDSKNIIDADVFWIGSTLWMLYMGGNDTHVQIGLANSTDNGATWTKYEGNPVIPVGASGAWDDVRTSYCRLLKNETGNPIQVSGVYYAFYTGYSGSVFSIGWANSSDLKTWTKYEGNPVMSPTAGWESAQLYSPIPWEDSGTYWMLYAGASAPWYSDIGLANSTDLISWTRYENNPVINRGASGQWDDQGVWGGDIIKVNSYYYLLYGGWESTYVYHVGSASSSDFHSWTKFVDNPITSGTTQDHMVYEEINNVWGAFCANTIGGASGKNAIYHGWITDPATGYKATFWVEVADDLSTTDQTIYIYYGKNDASTTSNGDNTFLFFDHFSYSTLDSSKWTEVNSPTVTVSSSILTITSATTNWRGVRSNDAYGPNNIAWRSRSKFTMNEYNLAGMQNASNQADDSMIFYWLTIDRERASTANEGVQQQTDLTEDGDYHVFDITWVSTVVGFYIDDVSKASHSTQVPNEALYVWIESYETSQNSDWVLIRKFVSPEPIHGSWGTEETYSPPPYLFIFYGLFNEDTGLLYDASERAVNVTAHFTTGENMTYTFEVNGTYSLGIFYKPLYFKFDLVNNREYWLGEDENTAVIYIFNVTSTVYTIDFIDLAGALNDYPFVSAKRYVNGTAHIVEKRKVDVEKKIIMALKNGEKYTITIQDGSSYEYGDLLVTSETTITLTLKGIEFPQNVILAYRYVRLYAERHNNYTSISLLYQDLRTDTENVSCEINYRNGTSAYTSTQYTNTFNVTWTSANENITYFVAMDAVHNEFGTINYRATMYRTFSEQPWGLGFLGSIPAVNTADIIPSVLILFVAAVFSKVNAYVAAFMATGFALFFAWYGWISIPAGLLVAALFMAIIMALIAKKERSD
jgi:hypothetical protein